MCPNLILFKDMKTATVFEPSLDKKATRNFTEVPEPAMGNSARSVYVKSIISTSAGRLTVEFWDNSTLEFHGMPFVIHTFTLHKT